MIQLWRNGLDLFKWFVHTHTHTLMPEELCYNTGNTQYTLQKVLTDFSDCQSSSGLISGQSALDSVS